MTSCMCSCPWYPPGAASAYDGDLPNEGLKNDLRLFARGESGGAAKELDREGELMFADSAAKRCLRVRGLGGMADGNGNGSDVGDSLRVAIK